MGKPTFSIIIPTLNEEKFLPNLLESLVTQTNKNFEVIVVDGSSNDKTIFEAKKYAKKLPALQVLSAPASLPGQRNLGATQARGEWLAFVDADSILMPYFMDRIEQYIHANKPQAFTTWVLPDSNISGDVVFTLIANIFVESTLIFHRPFAPGPMAIIQRNVFELVGGYDVTHKFNEDVEFGLRLKRSGVTISILREALYIWSMRRLRREGKIKVIQQMAISTLPVMLFKRPLKYLPGYIMGGQLYKSKKHIAPSVIKQFEVKLKSLMKEFFE